MQCLPAAGLVGNPLNSQEGRKSPYGDAPCARPNNIRRLKSVPNRQPEGSWVAKHRPVITGAITSWRGQQLLEIVLVEEVAHPQVRLPVVFRTEPEPGVHERVAIDVQILRRGGARRKVVAIRNIEAPE